MPYSSISVLEKQLVKKLWSPTMVEKCIESYNV